MNFIDLIQDDDFRNYVSQRLAKHIQDEKYYFPKKIPLLYKYRQFSKYAVNDILNKSITLSSIESFNDAFDSSIHKFSLCDINGEAEKEWDYLENIFKSAGITNSCISYDEYVSLMKIKLKNQSKLDFRKFGYLGFGVGCYTRKVDSILMWSHYAASNSGLCIEYDFNNLNKDKFLHKCIFPVAYTNKPIDLSDLLENPYDDYSLEKAVLCSTLTKFVDWNYEEEWRMFFPLVGLCDQSTRYIPLKIQINPKRIYLGCHFLKNFFYYSSVPKDIEIKDNNVEMFNNMLNFCESQNIPISVMSVDIGRYSLTPKAIQVKKIKEFMYDSFDDNKANEMKYYYAFYDKLQDIIENQILQGEQ